MEEKQEHQTKHWQLKKAVKKSARKDKQDNTNNPATQAEIAAHRRDIKELYDITRTQVGKRRNPSKSMKCKEGRTVNKEAEQY